MDIDQTLGITLRYDTREALRALGVVSWEHLCALPNRQRLLLYGWGPATEWRFQKRKTELAIEN